MSDAQLTVFLVEDSKTISDNLVAALDEIAQAKVAHISVGETEARAWLAANSRWAIAVVDLFLKEGSGLGVLKALQERKPSQRAVVLSNYATPAMRAQCFHLGADQVFDKSTELDEFLEYCLAMSERQR